MRWTCMSQRTVYLLIPSRVVSVNASMITPNLYFNSFPGASCCAFVSDRY